MAKGLAAADLRGATEQELDDKLAEAKIELFNLRFQAATGQLESHGRLRAARLCVTHCPAPPRALLPRALPRQ